MISGLIPIFANSNYEVYFHQPNFEPVPGMFVSPTGKFEIMFPDKPEQSSQVIRLTEELGNTTLYTFTYSNNDATYMVSYCEYPTIYIENVDKKIMLKNLKDGFEGNLSLNNDETEYITLQGYPGIHFKSKNNEYCVDMMDFIVDNKFYQIGILRSNHYPDSATDKGFFESLTFMKEY